MIIVKYQNSKKHFHQNLEILDWKNLTSAYNTQSRNDEACIADSFTVICYFAPTSGKPNLPTYTGL